MGEVPPAAREAIRQLHSAQLEAEFNDNAEFAERIRNDLANILERLIRDIPPEQST